MKLLISLLILFGLGQAQAEDVFRIEIGKDYKRYSDSDLKRRVWELERAVFQLQQKVFELQAGQANGAKDEWVCTVSGMGADYTGTGASKAVATHKAMENCKAKSDDDFFCKDAKCSK